MANNLNKIYETFGKDVCLFPFLSAFYSASNSHAAAPCSLTLQDINRDWSINNNNLLTTLNNDNWISIRKHFLEKKTCHTLDCCSRCSAAENNKTDSARNLNNQHFVEHLDVDIISEIQKIKANNYTVQQVFSLDYFPSNYCNYECIMCAGGASTRRNQFEIKVIDKSIKLLNKTISVVDDFEEVIKHTELINFTGGETILQPEVLNLIDWLIDNNYTDKKISLLTNASGYPDKYAEKLKQFREVYYTISIDGTHDVIEYQRRGSNWSTVETNALRIINDFSSVVNYVLTAVNVFRFTDLLRWLYFNNIDKIIISSVFNTDYLQPSVIPDQLRKELITKFENERKLFSGKYLIYLDKVITTLKETTYDPGLFLIFKEKILLEDSVSKKSLVEVIPEWQPYFND